MSVGPPLPLGYAAVLALVEERAGLAAPSCPAAAVEGIQRAMERSGLTDMEAYRLRLAEDSATLDDLLTELTVGETYFFRTHEHFEHLRRVVLPELRERLGPAHRVRVWSAACSSGEEPYSLAALLMAEGWEEHMSVYATDVSRTALARARQARYGEWSLRGPGADRIRPYLRTEGRQYLLSSEVKGHVRFGYLNLALDTWPTPGGDPWEQDIIFCRNVLIYFNRATIEGVARRLHASLAKGGVLFTGPSDPPLGDLAPLDSLLTEWGVLYRRRPEGATVAVPALPSSGEAPAPRLTPPPFEAPRATPPPFRVPAPRLTPPPFRVPAPRLTPPPFEAPGPRTPAPVAPVVPSVAPATEATPAVDAASLAGARRALARGDWPEAARQAGALDADPARGMAAVRALANLEPEAAVFACAEAAARHPLVAGLRYLEALLLLGQGRLPEAERAARQALYLEPGLAVAHLVLGHVLRRGGDRAGAARAYQEAERLCRALPPETLVPLAEGERAGPLADVARGERIRLASRPPEGGEESG